jgi:hypothetical protein
MRPNGAKKPRIPRPYSGEELHATLEWQPYPDLEPKVDYPAFGVLDALSSLHEIGLDLLPLVLSGNAVDTPNSDHVILDSSSRLAHVHELEQRLEQWHQSLPASIRSTETQLPRAPAEMDLL